MTGTQSKVETLAHRRSSTGTQGANASERSNASATGSETGSEIGTAYEAASVKKGETATGMAPLVLKALPQAGMIVLLDLPAKLMSASEFPI